MCITHAQKKICNLHHNKLENEILISTNQIGYIGILHELDRKLKRLQRNAEMNSEHPIINLHKMHKDTVYPPEG